MSAVDASALVPVPAVAPASGSAAVDEGPTRWERARKVVLPAALFLCGLAGWQYVTATGRIDALILASPAAIAGAFSTSGGEILANMLVTLGEALAGFAIGNTLGLLIAIAFVHSDLTRRTVYPLAIAAEAVPIVAIIPVLILWLGDGMAPKIFIAVFLTFFPMLVNAYRGLRSADAEVKELLYTLSASPRQVLFMVRLRLRAVPVQCPEADGLHLRRVVDRGRMAGLAEGLGFLITLYGARYQIPSLGDGAHLHRHEPLRVRRRRCGRARGHALAADRRR